MAMRMAPATMAWRPLMAVSPTEYGAMMKMAERESKRVAPSDTGHQLQTSAMRSMITTSIKRRMANRDTAWSSFLNAFHSSVKGSDDGLGGGRE
jgi:hypothetical protein